MLKLEDCQDIQVLYVEDDEAARNATVRILSKLFPNLFIAVDGKDGLEKYKLNKIDLVLTDINMPKMDGIEMLTNIRNIDSEFYSMVLTAYSDKDNFMSTINLGVKGYITKPINVSQLLETLEVAVKHINTKKELNILKQYKDIVDESSIVSKTDINGKITFVNDKFCEISGYEREELLGKTHTIVRHPDMEDLVFENLWYTIKNKMIWTGQIKNRKKDGTSYYVDSTIRPILDQNGDIIEYIGLRNEITDIINPRKQLQDSLKTSQLPFLAMIKIDQLETLEHLYNPRIIDEMLKTFEKMLFVYMPDTCSMDNVYNFGDGEFAILKKEMEDISESTASQKEIQLKQLQQNINKGTIVVDDYEFDLRVTISFATEKKNIYENVKYGLLEATEKKLDIIFSNGITDELTKSAIKNTETIKMIQSAIKDYRIVSYFQAITNNQTMEVEKYESLVRLIDDQGKVISPFFFLNVAKEGRYYNKITNIVVDNSFAALEKTDKEISINLSALDIEDLEIRNRLINLVTANMHNAHRIVFELLEDEEVKDFEIVKDFISLVKTFGVQIAIDDFGAGVSNFERLLDYQPDILKIDACLIKNIETDAYSRNVVETIQAFASRQGIKTVAEFVSNENILKIIKEIGINYSQGFLLGKPEPLDEQ